MGSLPVVFLGSSSEATEQAELVVKFLSKDAYVIPWWNAREFGGLASTLEALIEALTRYDFAIFLLTPDDTIQSRGEKRLSARDNVLFEAGLFLGAIGRERVEILIQKNKDKKKRVKIPSDLAGVTIPGYEIVSQVALDATINNALGNFRDRIRKSGKIKHTWKLVEGWNYNSATRTFSMTLGAAHLERYGERLTGVAFFIIVRKKDPDKDVQHDKGIFVSTLRHPTIGRELTISVVVPNTISIQPNDEMEGYLFCASTDFKVKKPKTIEEYKKAGAESIDGKATKVH